MNIFSHGAVATTSHKNVLTDGQLTCDYLEIPDIWKKIQRYFTEGEINTEDCLVLECDNSLPSALVLLYLLENGYSFLLLPKESNAPPGSNASSFIPKFCRYRIKAETSLSTESTTDLRDIEHLFSLSENEDWIGYQINPKFPQLYLRTSGSTGTPKIVVHSHTKLMKNAKNCVERLTINSEDRIAIPVPIFHMYGLGAAFLPSILAGAAIDLQKNSNPIKYIQREQEFNPNIAFTTPSFCDTLLKVRRVAREYKFTVVAGDRLKVKTFHQYESLCGCLLPLYGSTEMGAIAVSIGMVC
ncbi:AMP-binding protein [Limnofasciculus baicalensis]|uniref:AMP-binding protein n=1 Tax=Limnofasciculus baicalensis BBK-W-15 TaxID=2699891 RepID=A0AAE3GRB1_9CYAN|nr:AMP-binding protein [Limnofasciculus baicalensis]MCP2728418.1 AMP-binding protein [Limnofasciculus baicalensis BBK-W-15]